jgi:hypothetical protein
VSFFYGTGVHRREDRSEISLDSNFARWTGAAGDRAGALVEERRPRPPTALKPLLPRGVGGPPAPPRAYVVGLPGGEATPCANSPSRTLTGPTGTGTAASAGGRERTNAPRGTSRSDLRASRPGGGAASTSSRPVEEAPYDLSKGRRDLVTHWAPSEGRFARGLPCVCGRRIFLTVRRLSAAVAMARRANVARATERRCQCTCCSAARIVAGSTCSVGPFRDSSVGEAAVCDQVGTTCAAR